jgi:hypothetical protein
MEVAMTQGLDVSSPARRRWWIEGLRTAFFLKPRWQGLRVRRGRVIGVVLLHLVLGVLAQWLATPGEVSFYWQALLALWLPTLASVALCWCLSPSEGEGPVPGDDGRAPASGALFAMQAWQWLFCDLVMALVLVPAWRQGWVTPDLWQGWGWWLAWGVPPLWFSLMGLRLFWCAGHGPAFKRLGLGAVLAALIFAAHAGEPLQLWYPVKPASEAAGPPPEWTPDQVEAQSRTLPRALDALALQRPGVIDVYAVQFAPYADEDVFLREARMVSGVMQARFGAQGRSVVLANHQDTLAELPWATPANLARTLTAMARRMDLKEDVLFVHLTSHGARSGQLAASLWPLKVDPLTPALLKQALDDAGVRHRVISISACYSGSWIEALSDAETLVMTAADATHTSYGCGHGSELTFYGRAMFDEALRETWSFEEAFARAREVIDQREKEAKKEDGFSNPQIRMGASVGRQLQVLERQLDAPR